MTKFLGLAALLFIGACKNGGDTGDTSDTSVQTGVGKMTYNVFKPGDVAEGCYVNYECDSGSFGADSGKVAEIEDAPTDCTVEIGKTFKEFTFKVHKDLAGDFWASPLQDAHVDIGENDNGRADVFRIFQPGTYACAYDSFAYEASPPDHKGDFQFHQDLPNQPIHVDHGGKVVPEKDPNMDVIGNGQSDHMQVVGDQLVLQFDDRGVTNDPNIAKSAITNTGFTLTVVDAATGFVADVTCVLK